MAVLVASLLLALRVQGTTHGTGIARGILLSLAVVCAVETFIFPRRIEKGPRRPRKGSVSTPFTRWRAGKIAWLMLSTSVGLYGLCLAEFGGESWQVYPPIAVGLLLVAMGRPGRSPEPSAENAMTPTE
jgi:hypothetical protein